MPPNASHSFHSRKARYAYAATLCVGLQLAGCASSEGTDDLPDAKAPADAGTSGQPDAGPPTNPNACTAGQTQACVCPSGGVGERGCVNGTFGGACTACVQLNTSTGTRCQAGRYVGTALTTQLFPAAAGLCGIVTVFGQAEGDEAEPGPLAFTLEEAPNDVEFFEVVGVGNCLELGDSVAEADAGTADAGVSDAGAGDWADGDVVVSGLGLTGQMNCATGEFVGELRGTYYTVSVCDSVNKQHFSMKGTIRATYNPETKSFENGEWELHEPPQLLDPLCIPLGLCEPPGGHGVWEASLERAASAPTDESDEACYDRTHYEDFELPD